LINNKGILELLLKAISTNHYRVEKEEDMTYIEVNCSATAINADLAKIASGFYS
jgi:hypothetical protein